MPRGFRKSAGFASGWLLANASSRAEADTDYVLIGRRAALSLEFDQLVTDLLTGITALTKQYDAQQQRPRAPVDA